MHQVFKVFYKHLDILYKFRYFLEFLLLLLYPQIRQAHGENHSTGSYHYKSDKKDSEKRKFIL